MESEETEEQPKIYVVKTPKGKEIDILFLIRLRKNLLNLPIYSAFVLDDPRQRGLVFVEAKDHYSVMQAVAYARYTRVYKWPLSQEEMFKFIEMLKQAQAKTEVEEKPPELQAGMFVKIIRGPFKDRIARIISVSKSKIFLDLMSGGIWVIEVKPEDVKPVSPEEVKKKL